jgi:hypothetical protein
MAQEALIKNASDMVRDWGKSSLHTTTSHLLDCRIHLDACYVLYLHF